MQEDESTSSDLVDRLTAEGLLPLAEALRKAKVKVSVWTGLRWVKDGVRGGLCLEGMKVGGRWMTSVQAVRRFLVAQAAPRVGERRSSREGNRRTSRTREAARRYLQTLGLADSSPERGH